MAFLTLVWAVAFGTVFAMAQFSHGEFEFRGAGLVLVGAACVVRALDGERHRSRAILLRRLGMLCFPALTSSWFAGFLEVMIFRYIAVQYPDHRSQVTIFMGVVEKLIGFVFIAATSALIESNWFVA